MKYPFFTIVVLSLLVGFNPFNLGAKQIAPLVTTEQLSEAEFEEIFNTITSLKRTRPHEAIELAVSYMNDPNSLTDYQRYMLLFLTGESFAALDLTLTAIDVFTTAINFGLNNFEPGKIASWYMELGNLYYRERDYVSADSIYIQSYNLYKKSLSQFGNPISILGAATALNNRALVKAKYNDFTSAESFLNEALTLRLEANNPNHIAFNYISLAELYLKYTTKYDAARDYLIKADSLISDRFLDKDINLYRGLINEYLGDYHDIVNNNDSKVFFYKEALESYQENETRLEIQLLLKLYKHYKELKDESGAWEYLQKASDLAKMHGSYIEQKNVLKTQINWFKDKKDAVSSLKNAEELTALMENHTELEREVALKVGQLNRKVAQLDINLLNERNEKIKAEVNRNNAILALIILFVSGFIWYLKVQSDKNNERIIAKQKEELYEKALESERWRSLRMQLKPHFLYNVLSSLRALIQIDQASALKMTEHLAKYFRQILDAEQTETVKITSEIALCNEYLALQAIRFNNEISYKFDVPEQLSKYIIPSMLLFPLVENAVKYGYKTNPKDMAVRVEISQTEAHIRFSIANKGSWVEPRKDYKDDLYEGGLGFRNLKTRLIHHYGNDWVLNQKETEGFVTIEVLITLERFYKEQADVEAEKTNS